MRSGRTLWDELAIHYQKGVDWVRVSRDQWHQLSGVIDAERHRAVTRKLAIQERDAIWWKDASLSYFETFSQRPIPAGVEKPQRTLAEYRSIDLLDDMARGNGNGTFDENH
jgi:alpha-glucuronidase